VKPAALLIDFDGVLRRYDPAVAAATEERHGLRAGEILATALSPDLLRPAMLGQVSRAGWLESIADALADRVGGVATARSVVVEWDAYRGAVDPTVLAFVRDVRRAGTPVVLATNCTDDIDLDLAALGLTGELDAVAASAALGVAKPAPEYFTAACELAGAPADRCLLLDDSDRNVRGARAAGLKALRYAGPGDLRYARAALA